MYFSIRNACVTSVVRLKKCWPRTTETLSLGGLLGGQQGSGLPLGPEVGCPCTHGGQASQRQPLGQPRACQRPRFPIRCVWGSLSLCSALPGLRPPGKRPPHLGSRCPAHRGARCLGPWAGPELRAPGSRSGWAASELRAGDTQALGRGASSAFVSSKGRDQESEPRPQPPAFSPDHICPIPVVRPACWGPPSPHQAWPLPAPPLPQPLDPYSGSHFPGPAKRLRR